MSTALAGGSLTSTYVVLLSIEIHRTRVYYIIFVINILNILTEIFVTFTVTMITEPEILFVSS